MSPIHWSPNRSFSLRLYQWQVHTHWDPPQQDQPWTWSLLHRSRFSQILQIRIQCLEPTVFWTQDLVFLLVVVLALLLLLHQNSPNLPCFSSRFSFVGQQTTIW